jgi:acetyl esterase/lipase
VGTFDRMPRSLVVLALLIATGGLLVPPASARPTAPAGVRVTSGIVYGQGEVNAPAPGQADLLLDLYEPVERSDGRRPLVVLIHGGSRTNEDLVRIARSLAAAGDVVASIDYRLAPQDPEPSPRVATAAAAVPLNVPVLKAMVAAIDDTLTALDWLLDHHQALRIHRNRIGLVGSSAGTITADHVAYALDDLGIDAPRIRFVGDLWGGIFIPLDLAAAATQLDDGEAALFTVHGGSDPTVPVQLDDWLVAEARREGVPVEYLRVEGAGHGFRATGFFTREVSAGPTAFDRMLAFADDALG